MMNNLKDDFMKMFEGDFGDEPMFPFIPHEGLTALAFVVGSPVSATWLGMAGPVILGAWAWNNLKYLSRNGRRGQRRGQIQVVEVEAEPIEDAGSLTPMGSGMNHPDFDEPVVVAEPPLRSPEAESAVMKLSRQLALSAPEIETYQPRQEWDVIQSLAANLKSSLLIGVPGSGKGMLMSHWIRAIKQQHPELQIWGIDPKDDPKETGYWKGGFDKVFRANNERMSNAEFIGWLNNCLDKFRMAPDGKILLWDEFTISCRRWNSHDKVGFRDITDWLVSLSSGGDSRRNYVLAMGQVPNAADMGMSGGIRGVFKPIGLLSNSDRAAVQQFISTTFVPVPKGGIEELYSIMDKSPCGRAIFISSLGEWRPMPVLENLSGYDRDNRQWLNNPNPVDAPADEFVPVAAPAIEAKPVGLAPEDELMQRARDWVKSLGDCPITLSLAATSGWVAWGRRNGVLPDAKQPTVAPWIAKLEAEGVIRPLGQKGNAWLPVVTR